MVCGDDQLVAALRTVAEDLVESGTVPDLDATLDRIVASAVELIDGADEGGLSRTHHMTGYASHATSAVVSELDRLQDELNEGPCITAVDEPPPDGLILAKDLAGADQQRWPSFAPRAVACGFRSMLSAQLTSGRRSRRSSLNLYSRQPDAFDQDAQTMAGLFAVEAGTLLYGADAAAGMAYALNNRDMIGRAKGILMERFTLTDAAAFQMLVRTSQDTNIKVVEVSRWLTNEAEHRARGTGVTAGQNDTDPDS